MLKKVHFALQKISKSPIHVIKHIGLAREPKDYFLFYITCHANNFVVKLKDVPLHSEDIILNIYILQLNEVIEYTGHYNN